MQTNQQMNQLLMLKLRFKFSLFPSEVSSIGKWIVPLQRYNPTVQMGFGDKQE